MHVILTATYQGKTYQLQRGLPYGESVLRLQAREECMFATYPPSFDYRRSRIYIWVRDMFHARRNRVFAAAAKGLGSTTCRIVP